VVGILYFSYFDLFYYELSQVRVILLCYKRTITVATFSHSQCYSGITLLQLLDLELNFPRV